MRYVVSLRVNWVRNWTAVPLEQFQKPVNARQKKKIVTVAHPCLAILSLREVIA